MSNWDLMMPGMGLTAIGLAGVTISYAGIAHTFVDGMHALTGLTMFVGLIFLSAGILEGGVSTSNRAKATTLVILGISFSFGLAALNFNAVSTIPTFAGVMLIITVPSIVMAYVAMKMPQYTKPVSIIFIIAVGAAIAAYVGFGLFGPSPYLVPPPAEVKEVKPTEPSAPVFSISILKGSAVQGNPDYDPDEAKVPAGNIIEWKNNDEAAHTVTSSADAGAAFDSSLISPGATFRLDAAKLTQAKYEYMCVLHPWMTASFEIIKEGQSSTTSESNQGTAISEAQKETAQPQVNLGAQSEESTQAKERAPEESQTSSQTQSSSEVLVSIPAGASTPGCDSTSQCYIPSSLTVKAGTTVVWSNDDTAAHTVTSGSPASGPDGKFDSNLFSAGAKYSYKFEEAGQFPYFCQVHPWMTGSVTVE